MNKIPIARSVATYFATLAVASALTGVFDVMWAVLVSMVLFLMIVADAPSNEMPPPCINAVFVVIVD